MTEKELLEKRIQCLEKNLSNIEHLKEKHLAQAFGKPEEIKRIEEHYQKEKERVIVEKSELEKQLTIN